MSPDDIPTMDTSVRGAVPTDDMMGSSPPLGPTALASNRQESVRMAELKALLVHETAAQVLSVFCLRFSCKYQSCVAVEEWLTCILWRSLVSLIA